MANPTLRKDIFSWINRVMEKLSSHGADIKPFDYLKETI